MDKPIFPRKVGKQQAIENAQTAWDEFVNLAKTVIDAPKPKKRKSPKKRTKKKQRKGV